MKEIALVTVAIILCWVVVTLPEKEEAEEELFV